MADRIELQRRDHIAVLTLSHPEARNALTWRMYEQLADACDVVDADANIRVAVIRSAGGKAFAAGTDIRQFTAFSGGEDGVAYERRTGEVIARLAALRMPAIAAVSGVAAGAGLAIATTCDIVVATSDATFSIPIARTLGNCLSPALIARLHRRIGPARTANMVIAGRALGADDAYRAGFVSAVVDRADFDGYVDELTARIATHAPLTLAAYKEVARRLDAAAADVEADDVIRQSYDSHDFHAGVQAFIAKRTPTWEGR